MKKTQTGFAPLLLVFVVAVAVSVATGGYVTYTSNQQAKNEQKIEDSLKSEPNKQVTNTSNQISVPTKAPALTPVPVLVPVQAQAPVPASAQAPVKSVSQEAVKSKTTVETNCDGNWQCLIAAAKSCQSTSGIVTSPNVPNPLMKDYLVSVKNKYEIKSSGANICTLTYFNVKSTMSFTDKAKADMLAQGMTKSQIDAQLIATNRETNEALKEISSLPTICTSDANTITSFLTDTNNGYGGKLSFSSSSSGLMTTKITTSTGQILTCTMQTPEFPLEYL